MARMPQFGRAVHAILVLAILVLVITYGGMEIWPRVEAYRMMQALDRRWHDPGLSAAARAKAAEMLAEFGPEAAPYLLAAARDADGRVRERAYDYLAGLEPMTDEVVRICLAALKEDREPRARASAAKSLGSIAYVFRATRVGQRQVIIESLVAAGCDESPIVRRAAVRAMIGAGAVGVDPGPWLVDPDRLVRLAAAEAIFWLDPRNKGRMIPTLRAMIVEADPARPGDVHHPLGLMLRVDPSACRVLVPTFAAWLRHEDERVRLQATGWLMTLGPLARDALPALQALLDRGGPAERSRAAVAIVAIDPAACESAAASLLALFCDATIPPAERIAILAPLSLLINHAKVPPRVRDQTLKTIRAVSDEPGVHPDFGLRVRMFLEYQGDSRTTRAAATAAQGVRIQ
jgi:HEAT repeat protein